MTFGNNRVGVIVIAAVAFSPCSHVVAQTDVTAPGDAIFGVQAVAGGASSISTTFPAAEGPNRTIDDNSLTKYLNFSEVNTGVVVSPALPSVVTGLRLTTANDAPERDPLTYTLEGTNEGTPQGANVVWALIASGNTGLQAVFARRAQGPMVGFANTIAYNSYRLLFPTVRDSAAANSMQLSEIELFGSGAPGPDPGPADFDDDGDVDVADYVFFLSNLHTNITALTLPQSLLLGDLTADLRIDGRDFVFFRTAFDEANGVGAFAAMAQAVPEPSAAALLAAALATTIIARRRRA